MIRIKPSLSRVALLLVAVVLTTASFAFAQVHDNAKIFSPDAVQKADTAIAAMKAKHNKELVVETFADVPADQQSALQSQGKTDFFNNWLMQRAQADKVNGVMALICMNPKFIKVDAGAQTKARGDFTEADVTRLREQLQSDFHGGQFDQGLSNAVDMVERTYTANIGGSAAPGSEPAAVPGRSSSTGVPSFPGSSSSPSHSTGMGLGLGTLLCLGVGVLLIVSLIHSIFSRRGGGGGYGGGFGGGGGGYPMGGQMPGPGYGGGMGRSGGGFGSGLLGGLLGGAVGGYAADKWDHRNDGGSSAPSGGTAGFPEPSSGGGGGGFDSGPSDAGQGFGSGGGGDFGGGGGGGDAGGSF